MKKSLIELSQEIDAHFTPVDAHLALVTKSKGAMVLPLAAAVAAAESWIVYTMMMPGAVLTMGILAHMAIVLLLTLCAWALYRNKGDSRFVIVLCLAVLAAGPFGALGTMLAIIVGMGSRKTYRSFDEFFEGLSPSLQKTRSQVIYEDIMSGRDDASDQHSVIPFLDVISFGSEVQKRQALAKMTNHYQADFAPVFRKALNDPSNMIRVQAATAIARVESQFLKRMNKLSVTKLLAESNPEMLRAVAEHYDNYAYTGLLDKDTEIMNRSKALELYNKYLQLKPDDHDIYVKIGRIMMKNGQHAQACHWFRQYIDRQPPPQDIPLDTQHLGWIHEARMPSVAPAPRETGGSSGRNTPFMTRKTHIPHAISDWYSESLFLAGNYAELRRYRSALPAVSTRDDLHSMALKEALQLWEGRHANG